MFIYTPHFTLYFLTKNIPPKNLPGFFKNHTWRCLPMHISSQKWVHTLFFCLIITCLFLPSVEGRDMWKFALGPVGHIDISGGQDLKSGSGFGLSAYYQLSHRIGLFIDVSRLKGNVQAQNERFSGGTYALTPIQFGVRFLFPVGETTRPYLSVSGGFMTYALTVAENVRTEWDRLGMTVREDIESGISGTLGLGLEQRLSKRFSIAIDIRYLIGGPQGGSWSFKDKVTGLQAGGTFSQVSVPRLSSRLNILITF